MSAAFDTVAPGYDEVALSRLGRLLRARVHRRVLAGLEPGSHVLDLGGGTGIDAVDLARAGHRVTLVDSSPAMVTLANRRARAAGVELTTVTADLDDMGETGRLPAAPGPGGWNLVLSNFGALNALADPVGILDAVAPKVEPGGRAVIVVMGRICPWELLRGRGRRLTGEAAPEDGSTATVRYHRASVMSLSLRRWRESDRESLGWALPPFESRGVIESRPRLAGVLAGLDRFGAPLMGRLGIGDHWLMVLDRVES